MSVLPEQGWLYYQSPADAVGADRRFPLVEREGSFAVPSAYAFKDFLTDILLGKSEHNDRFSYEDVIGFMESKWYLFFANTVPNFHYDEAPARSEYWECGNGHEPTFVIYVGEQREIPAVQRLRPIDILDMWLRSPHTLDVIFPASEDWSGHQTIGDRSDLSISHATCGECGVTFEGFMRVYKAKRQDDHDLSNGIEPITLDYILSANGFYGIRDAFKAANDAGVSLSALVSYFSLTALGADACKSLNAEVTANYSLLVEAGWKPASALLGVAVSGWFSPDDRTAVEDALTRQGGSEGFEVGYVLSVLSVFKKSESKNAGFFIRALDEDLDPAIVESMMKPAVL